MSTDGSRPTSRHYSRRRHASPGISRDQTRRAELSDPAGRMKNRGPPGEDPCEAFMRSCVHGWRFGSRRAGSCEALIGSGSAPGRAGSGDRGPGPGGTGRMSRHVSRILFPGALRRSRSAAIHLGLPLPTGSCGLPAGIGRAALDRLRRCPEAPSWPCSGWGLPSRSRHRERWWSLTPPFHPYPGSRRGGLFSVALSRGSPLVAVDNHPALWSPDFPRRRTRIRRRGRPADSSAPLGYRRVPRLWNQVGETLS